MPLRFCVLYNIFLFSITEKKNLLNYFTTNHYCYSPQQPLLAQLKIGGRLVIPVGDDVQVMTLLVRTSETHFEQHEFGDFKFVPMLEDKNR